ncbi:putative endonuclease 8 2 [Pseudoclavibacter endophyticus]|uniref:DNA-(apurinic or apyrimidinic site) lyase n=1 Tax=Pseudoclavibacter endophyticus TaxID=1778590 RepID=A0A6H9WJJ1_9MICO|nr:DNA-formamidopyrimidine glycosylase family protein [Pseudoclavibacter endophyticus]KAB1647809.1 Fpg/Nei family DNA glycosylase [Pseudoclavibacter endophyticus]GGA73013.1 putative endonuclease 8 2 [Pseudoclavibacter endophyticus]
MPEGDSVYRACADLHVALAGRRVTRVDLRVPRLATAGAALRSRTLDEVVPRGKHLLMRLGDHTLHSHLGMDGAWRLVRPGGRWPAPAHHVRAVLETADATAIGTLLPVLELLPRDREADAVGHLGPDLLDPAWGPQLAADAAANLRRDPHREIAAALLDQRNLAGLGNVYVTELCFLRGVRPTVPLARAGDLDALVALARRTLHANRMRPAGRVFTGIDRRGARTWVYGREGQPCRRCGTPIEAGRHGDDGDGNEERSDRSRRSAWCPRCQPPPE